MIVKVLFWITALSVIYAYIGYPLVLVILGWFRRENKVQLSEEYTPSLSIIIPAYNEEGVIGQKLKNTLELIYPQKKLEIIIVSDGSIDKTKQIVQSFLPNQKIKFIEVSQRKGKSNALNLGLDHASGEIIVFSDSSILLEPNALLEIVKGFQDEKIGCISGEDHIPGNGGEGLYGKYELFLRNKESRIGSIVGASGSFYAQRKELCMPFVEGLAPDFLSVLNTIEQGYRAISEPKAKGMMSSADETEAEFRRKVRTLLRGMTTLWFKRNLISPFNYGMFAFFLLSHKLVRWLVPSFLIVLLVTNMFLLSIFIYQIIFLGQFIFYIFGFMAWWKIINMDKKIIGKIPLYFSMTNIAILQAWILFINGTRQEIWEPTRRNS
jgi:cellulose synthase/poly-beta-1,6-N-acetylglucosamine synthase-like glycosyltransferase